MGLVFQESKSFDLAVASASASAGSHNAHGTDVIMQFSALSTDGKE
jgi:hypothetical protein